MTIGDPIYLVSACTSGEEFVAAFRRYVDRNGLFVPISDPIAVGKRGRFALTLRDGGVMIEGDGEVISSAKTPSVLHGRIGMTIRFAELDDSSKTVITELEKARLAMKPPAPSVPPRAANVPAEPRAVPPAPAGRIDASNALAQCVAIGDVEALATADKSAPPKAGPKFVVPTIPPQRPKSPTAPPGTIPPIPERPRSASTPPAGMPPVRPKSPTTPPAGLPPVRPQTPSTPPAIAEARTQTLSSPPPFDARTKTISTPPPFEARTQTISSPPPFEARTQTISSPPPFEARTQTISSPPPFAEPRAHTPSTEPTMAKPVELPVPQTDEGMPTGMSATMTAVRPPVSGMSETMPAISIADIKPPAARTPIAPIQELDEEDEIQLGRGIILGNRTPTEMPAADDLELGKAGTSRAPEERTSPHDPLTLAPLETPTQMSAVPPPGSTAQIMPAVQPNVTPTGMAAVAADRSVQTQPMPPLFADEPPLVARTMTKKGHMEVPAAPIVAEARPASVEAADEPTDLSVIPVEPADEEPKARKTTLGIAVSPSGATVLPGIAPEVLPDTTVMPAQPKPASDELPVARAPVVEEHTPSGDWTMKPGETGPTIEEQPRTKRKAEPSGDWTISLTGDNAPAWQDPVPAPAPPPPAKKKKKSNEPPREGSGEAASDSQRSPMIADEPKVQIDPTLIEPLTPMPALDEPPAVIVAPVPVDVPSFPPPLPPTPMPAMGMVPMGMGPPIATAHEVPSLPQQMPPPGAMFTPVPSASPLAYQNIALPPQRVVTDGGTGFFRESGDIKNLHDSTSLIAAPRDKSRRVLVIAISASLVVIGGLVLLFVLMADGEQAAAPADASASVTKPVADASVAVAPPVDAAVVAVTADAAVAAVECSVTITSAPAGAEVVHDNKVIGVTPASIPLPCDEELKLVVRKAKWTPVTRAVVPTEGGAKLKVALAKQVFSVKVSSQPAGAQVLLNGKSIGVTPTTVKLPAFEASTLTLNKVGFNPETLRVTPKQNNQAVQAQLKKKKVR